MENKELIEPLQKENTPNEDYTKKMQSSKKRLNIKLDIIRKYAGESIVLFVHKYFYCKQNNTDPEKKALCWKDNKRRGRRDTEYLQSNRYQILEFFTTF